MFGRLLVAAKSRQIELKEVLTYELSAVPYALVHPDGSLRKTTKSVLLSEPERVSPAVGRLPRNYLEAALIYDGMALLQSMKSAGCTTFGDLAQKLFRVITAIFNQEQFSRADVVFDRYDNPCSIKGEEREQRGLSSALKIQINSGKTPIPKQWGKYISNPRYKTSLVRYLCETWCDMAKRDLEPGKRLFIGGGFSDPSNAFEVVCGNATALPKFQTDHEEAIEESFCTLRTLQKHVRGSSSSPQTQT